MRTLIAIANGLNKLRDIPLLFFRLLLSYGYWGPFFFKVQDIGEFAQYLANLGFPAPWFWAWVSLITEGLGILFLFFGFATRIITLPLMTMMVIAVTVVHWANGYDPGNNGFAIPLVYLLMLFCLFIMGPGKISIDGLITGAYRRKTSPPGE